MVKGKKSSVKSAPKKAAAHKSPAPQTEAPKPVAQEIAAKAPVLEPHLLAVPVRTAKPSAAELYDEIRRRAYEFYRERGGQHGSHEADWHRAELQVRAKYR